MKTIHLLTEGNIGGIETLCKDYAHFSVHENIMLILWGDGPLAEEMQKIGIKVINLHAPKKNILMIMKKVYTVCMEEKAQAIIAHHASPISHLCLLYVKNRDKNIRTVAYAHGNAVDMVRSKQKRGLPLRKLILQMSLKYGDKVVAISDSVKKSLIDYFKTPEENITVIYNGVDIKRFSTNKEKRKNDIPELIYVGRLIPEKGVQVILEGLSCVKEKIPFHFRIVGDGSYRTHLEERVCDLGLTDRVEFCGSRRDIPELLSSSDVFIHMPVWEEGFGITIVEAMAAGLICICADSGAIPEIITDGCDGFLVKKEDPVCMAQVLEHVLQMQDTEKERIGKSAEEKAKNFSIETFVKNLDGLIDGLEIK